MESYQKWFGEGPELSVLRLLGLFDRPAEERALEALLKSPPIPGLTESLVDLSPSEWRTILARLRRARLLAGKDPHHPGHLDTHPLVREHFGEQLRSQQTDGWKECNRRLYHCYRPLAPELPDAFREMEPLFLTTICACNAELFREALHEVYLPRIQRGNASFAANVLGARGALLSVLVHFFEDGQWGSLVDTGIQGQRLTAEDQLLILMQAALYLTANQGYSAPEARRCYERAEALCHSLHRALPLYSALMGQWRYSLMTDTLTATMQIAQCVFALAQGQNEPALLIGGYRVLAMTRYYLGDFKAARGLARRGAQLWRSAGRPSPVEEVVAPAVSCLCYQALSEWHLVETAFCRMTMAEALSLARELKDMHGLAAALWHAMLLGHYEGHPAEVERLASELIELCTRQHFAQWLTGGKLCRGWARSAAGDSAGGFLWIEDALRDYGATGSMMCLPYGLGLKAEVLHLAGRTPEALEAIREAAAVVERRGERWWSAELHRLRGVFLAAIGANETEIEASFCAAIRTAKQQKSISLMKRAEASLTEYRRQRASGSGGRGFRLPLW